MRKKILIRLTTVILAFSLSMLAGCTNPEETSSTVTEQQPATDVATETPILTPAPTETQVPTPTTEPTETPSPTTEPTEAPTPTTEPTEAPTPTTKPTEAPTPTPKPTEAPTPTTEPTEAPTPTTEPTEAPTPTTEPTEAPTPTTEPTEAPTPTTEPTEAPTPTTEPTEAPTPTLKPTEAPTPTPEPTEAPIVQTVGDVDSAAYEKAVNAFESIVKKMRADGLVTSSNVCVTMDSTSITVDITFDDSDIDLKLYKDISTNIYTLTLDYNFTWLEGLGSAVNGKDPALYNKDLLAAILSMISKEPQVLFHRIDLDCFSPAGLSDTEWTEIGDCFIKSGGMAVDEYISYNITKESKDTRDASYVLTGTTSSGSTVECVIEYDSSLVSYELKDNGNMNWTVNGHELPSGMVTYMHTLDETKFGPYCYPVIKTGCTSYTNYKQNWLDTYIAQGDPNASIYEYGSHTVNGYTYYWFEGTFMTETDIGDPDIVYVQIGENEYIELYNVMFEERFEEFINSSFYIKEVRIK